MHIVTVDKFLCCLSLEFGGYFLGLLKLLNDCSSFQALIRLTGWLGVISSISALVVAVGVGVLAYMSFETLTDYVTLSVVGVSNEWITTIVLESRISRLNENLLINNIFLPFLSSLILSILRGLGIRNFIPAFLPLCSNFIVSWNQERKQFFFNIQLSQSWIFQRNHERIVPILAIIVLELLLNFLQLLSSNWQSITSVVISTIIDLYIYICIYSLYVKLKNEKKYKFHESA